MRISDWSSDVCSSDLTIPDQFDSEVELVPEGVKVGTLNEDFAFESLPGDIVQLGNTSYRIIKIETGRVLVEDAKGQPPTMPFWLGEGLGRSDELSTAVCKLRTRAAAVFGDDIDAGSECLKSEYAFAGGGAAQLAYYNGSAQTALGLLTRQ